MSSDETLKRWAHELMEETAAVGAVVEDPVSICAYVSRTRGVELTIEEGGKVREHLLAFHDTAEVQS